MCCFWCSRIFPYHILVASIVIKMCDCDFRSLFVFVRHSSSFFLFFVLSWIGCSRWASPPRWELTKRIRCAATFALLILYFWEIKIYFLLLLILNKINTHSLSLSLSSIGSSPNKKVFLVIPLIFFIHFVRVCVWCQQVPSFVHICTLLFF